jgi:hypothetical protein
MRAAMTAWVLLTAACGGATPGPATTGAATPTPTSTPTPTPTGTPTSTPTGTSTPAPPPPATGGSVVFGDIASAKSFDPKPVITSLQQQFLDCYNKSRGANPELRGKLRLRLVVNDTGTVVNVQPEEGGLSTETALIACLGDAAKSGHFPKPGGMATVTVPMLFRP